MRFMLMHRTTPHWEAGASPGPELVARVGKMIGEMAEKGVLLGAEGLRASSQGARVEFAGGRRTITPGPYPGKDELPAGFAILRLGSLDEAVAWASRLGEALGDARIDVRPVTEPWDIGAAPRPEGLSTRRFMLMHMADAALEAGAAPAPQRAAGMARVLEDMTRAGVLLTSERLEPSSKGVRLATSKGKPVVTDGPFAESKELVGGYVIVEAASLEEAKRWALRYVEAVSCHQLDVRQVAEKA